MNKITVQAVGGPIEIETRMDYASIKMGAVSFLLSSSDARAIASELTKFADRHGIVKPVRDPHSLLLVLVECMSTFDDTDPASIERTQAALLEYERSGDHNHGPGPIPPGGACIGHDGVGDCWVARVRKELASLKKVK